MRSDTLATITVALLSSSGIAFANPEYPTTTVGPTSTDTCYTISTPGPTCPAYTCALPACEKISTITQSCGCASIHTRFSCDNPCSNACVGTSYSVVYLPCPVSPPPTYTATDTSAYPTNTPSSYPTEVSSPYPTYSPSLYPTETTTVTTSSYPIDTSPPPPPPDTSTKYGNSTMTTTSSGGRSGGGGSGSGANGGGGGGGVTASTGTTTKTAGNVPPQPTSSSEPGLVPANVARRIVATEWGLLAALITIFAAIL